METTHDHARAYLDHAATAPMPAAVFAAYTAALRSVGNPSSTHAHGQAAGEQLETAREVIATALGCDRAEVTLTGGGTESINLALKGIYWARRRAGSGNVILLADGEHHATMEAAQWLESSQGARIVPLPITAEGRIEPATLERVITEVGAENIALGTWMLANNEVGTLQPIAELGEIAARAGFPVHVDAVAALGQVPIRLRELRGAQAAGVGLVAVSVSAHKIGGPVGVGALVLHRTAQADPLFHGGTQQRSRSGSQNVAGAIGFAAALDAALTPSGEPRPERIAAMRETAAHILRVVAAADPTAVVRGPDPLKAPADRLPGNVHVTFPGCQGDSLVFLLDAAGVSASVGSACQAGVAELSHVLLAMGLSEELAAGALRFTFGAETRPGELAALAAALPEAVRRSRAAGLS